MKIAVIRNFLLVLGCYYLSMWVFLPIALICGKITSGIIYTGTSGAVLMHIVTAIPLAIVSFGAGMLIKYILEGSSYKQWILLLALIFVSRHFIAVHWVIKPDLSNRALQLFESIIPAITCYMGSKVPFKITKKPI